MSRLSNRERSLVAIGAAIASNCVPCVEFHVPAARRVGLDDDEIHDALRIADKVRQVPSRAVFEAVLARIETSPAGSPETAASGCGCGTARGTANDKEVC